MIKYGYCIGRNYEDFYYYITDSGKIIMCNGYRAYHDDHYIKNNVICGKYYHTIDDHTDIIQKYDSYQQFIRYIFECQLIYRNDLCMIVYNCRKFIYRIRLIQRIWRQYYNYKKNIILMIAYFNKNNKINDIEEFIQFKFESIFL